MKQFFTFCAFFTMLVGAFAQNYGLSFDGEDDFVELCDSDDFNVGDGFTVEAWILAKNWKAEFWAGSILNKDQHPGSGFGLRAGKNGSLSFVVGTTAGWPEVVTDPFMNENQWYHVAAVMSGNTVTLYVNGAEITSGTIGGTPVDNNVNALIGESPGYPGRFFDGNIDEVRIWDLARTGSQINEFHKQTLQGDEDGLVAYYPMEENSGNVLENLVEGGCDGDIKGAKWSEGWTIPAFDVGVVRINSPDVLSVYERAVKVNVTIQNFGSETVTEVPLTLSVNGLPELEETYTGSLAPGETVDFTFSTPIHVIENNTNLLTASSSLAEDTNSLNDPSAYRFRKPQGGSIVNLLNEEQFNFGAAGQAKFSQVNMPENMEDFDQILLHFSLDCPSTGCDPWDQPAKISFISKEGIEYEVVRFVTPYGKGCGPWTVDITDFKTVIDGPIEMKSFIQVWGQSGWLLTADLEFVKADLPKYHSFQSLWQEDNWIYGEPTFDDDLEAVSVSMDDEMESSHVRMTITGHGQGNTNNAAEFSNFTHNFNIDGQLTPHSLWRNDCAQNPCSNQSGTWTLSRAGWCPGEEVSPYILDLGATPGQSILIDYELNDYTNLLNTGYNGGSHTEPHYRLHAFVIQESKEHMDALNNLRATDVVVGTNNNPSNPEFQSVILNIKNTGSVDISNASVSYFVNGEIALTETLANVAAGQTVVHTFSSATGFTAGADNLVFGVVTSTGDENINDDVAVNLIDGQLTGTEDLQASEIKVFPNPTDGAFVIEVEDVFFGGTIELYSVEGKLLESKSIHRNKKHEMIQVVSGVYTLKLNDRNGDSVYRKVVVQ